MRLLNLSDHDAVLEKDGRGQHQNGDVDEHGAVERDYGIDQVVAAGCALGLLGVAETAGLHQRRMQIYIVGHHGSAQHGNRYIQAVAIETGDQAAEHFARRWLGPQHLNTEAARHDRDEGQDEGFDGADAEALKPEQEQGIGGGDQHAEQERDVEQQVEPDGRAQNFGQIAGRNGDLAKAPEDQVDLSGIGFAAGLGQVAPTHNAEPGAQSLEQNGHGVGHNQDPQELVAETRAAFKVSGPVARVHVAHADQVSRAGKGEHTLPERHLGGADGGVNLGQGTHVRLDRAWRAHEI